jgi:3-hydroxyacyl-[acyl-carrier-protein] dehydratase
VFEGHFPGNPLLPGALSIEVMAQAAGFLAMLNVDLTKMGYLLALENARFRVPVRPGTTLTAVARRTHLGSGYAAFRCALSAGSTQVASAELRIKLSEFENDVLRESVLDRLAQLRLTERWAAAQAQ